MFIKTIPYGRHDKGDSDFPRIPARISFAISQFIPGIFVFSLTYFFQRYFDRPSNIIMYCLFTIYYINRSIVDGIASRHSQSKSVCGGLVKSGLGRGSGSGHGGVYGGPEV